LATASRPRSDPVEVGVHRTVHTCSPFRFPAFTATVTITRYGGEVGGCAPGAGAEAVQKGAATPLAEALRDLGLDGDLSLDGRWLTLAGDRFRIFVVASARGGYFTWCDDPAERTVLFQRDARAAIATGLRRAADGRREQEV